MVSIRSAVCVMGGFPALAGADLDVNDGETVLLSGPNGAGKSTLLRLVAGLVPLRAGSATVLGTDLARDRRRHRRQLALVGHDTFCYDDLTVGENARFAAAAAGRSYAAAATAVDRMHLTSQVDVRYGRLSAGQRRRLAIAVAIAREPRLLLLDEPHAGLDSEGRELLDEIVRGARSDGVTTIIASHEVERARPLATREVRVDAGLVHGASTAGVPPAIDATPDPVPAALGGAQ